jgi:type IV pilus assembly protein PilA
MKKSNLARIGKKKGFTLIELIVVIAILGILAAIAIPRFAGFTDKAKLAADEQYGALIGNALVVLLAEGEFTGNVEVSVDKDGSFDVTTAGTAGSGAALSAGDTRVTDLVAQKALKQGAAGAADLMTVAVTGEGVVTVTP